MCRHFRLILKTGFFGTNSLNHSSALQVIAVFDGQKIAREDNTERNEAPIF